MSGGEIASPGGAWPRSSTAVAGGVTPATTTNAGATTGVTDGGAATASGATPAAAQQPGSAGRKPGADPQQECSAAWTGSGRQPQGAGNVATSARLASKAETVVRRLRLIESMGAQLRAPGQ